MTSFYAVPAWAVLGILAQEVPEPEDVKAGWVAFGLFLLLVAAVVFLAFSFRKQLRKVNFEERDDSAGPARRDSDGRGEKPAP